ncbi:hypothetical protein ACLQ2R_17535 [Streptosporangium sp. DT93]|uniref:hypothetical protein n=1 Tax=Streptosporangium sp. DT93 TaxID=3393428 RepID=UPI003CE6EDBC
MADRVKHDPAPRGQGWIELRLIGEPADIEAWTTLLHHGTDIWLDSHNKTARADGLIRRYIRARLAVQDPDV